MEYKGKHPIFDNSRVRTYPVATRRNKVHWDRLYTPKSVLSAHEPPDDVKALVAPVANAIRRAHANNWPVILFSGAHVLKNGFGPLIIDWMERGILSLYAVNTAGTIHDFELALIGETSEYVPNVLGNGEFGMAYEFAYINEAIREGNRRKIGYGESLSNMITDAEFQQTVMQRVWREGAPIKFTHPEISVLAASARTGVPMTVHAIIGGDVIDQQPSFDGEAKGGTSGRDFLIFVEHIRRLKQGGVFINMGSAVIGPEVFLKSISIASNVGDAPSADLVTADFDIRPEYPQAMTNERHFAYYFRDQKSVVTRIPNAFGGHGFYVQGDQLVTLPELYRQVIRGID
jgi:hypothetical protein